MLHILPALPGMPDIRGCQYAAPNLLAKAPGPREALGSSHQRQPITDCKYGSAALSCMFRPHRRGKLCGHQAVFPRGVDVRAFAGMVAAEPGLVDWAICICGGDGFDYPLSVQVLLHRHIE